MPPSNRPTCMPLAQEFCQGRGLEIGAAAYSDFGVDALNLDLTAKPLPLYATDQLRLAGRVSPIDLVGFAETMPIRTDSQDFLLASHVIEHSPNPIKTLLEWNRIIRPGGVLFLIVPHKERTADRVRPRTSLAHVVEDYQTDQTPATHHETDDFLTPAALHMPHYHAWITVDFLEIVAWIIEQGLADWYLEMIEDVDSHRQIGFTLVLRKQAGAPARSRAGSWVSRRALRAMLRCPEQIALLRARHALSDADLHEVTAGSLISQDILIQELERYAKRLEQEVAQQAAELDGLRAWASEMQARLLAIQTHPLHIPALARALSRLARLDPRGRAAPAPPSGAPETPPPKTPPPPERDEAFFDHLVTARSPRDFHAHQRWGSGEVEITALELLDAAGRPQDSLCSGEPATLRIRYVAHQPVPEVVFGLAIHYHNGVQVCAMNTAALRPAVRLDPGAGAVECAIESLGLLAGTYRLSAAVYEPQLQHAYDHRHFTWTLTISGERNAERDGLVGLAHRWEIDAAPSAALAPTAT